MTGLLMVGENTSSELAGTTIQEIFKCAKEIAELHACLTSPRGDNFRLRLLQETGTPLDEETIERIRVDSSINEYRRHLNMLIHFKLLVVHQIDGKQKCLRTPVGEMAINALREFERRMNKEAAKLVYEAALGTNSIRLFLRVYGDKRDPDWGDMEIRYTPEEIGRLSLFLPRVIEGLSAIDKLNEADLLAYRDDGHVYMHPTKARSFYQYLRELHKIWQSNSAQPGG